MYGWFGITIDRGTLLSCSELRRELVLIHEGMVADATTTNRLVLHFGIAVAFISW